MKKFISVLLVITIVFSMIGTVSFADVNSTENNLATVGGFLNIEAEDLQYSEKYEEYTAAPEGTQMSGRAGIRAASGYDLSAPSKDADADIDLSFVADVAGTYHVWMRATSGQWTSIFVSLNNGNYSYHKLAGDTSSEFYWGSIAETTVSAGAEVSLRVRVRHTGYIIDEIIITSDPSYVPTDTPNVLTTVGGFLEIEAEDLQYSEKYEEYTTAPSGTEMSGGAGIKATSGQDLSTPPSDADADIDLSFVADVAGMYNVWIRSTSGTYESIFVSQNNGKYTYHKLEGASTSEFYWGDIAEAFAYAGDIVNLRLRVRHRGNIIDKIIITSNLLYIPAGVSGEAENGWIDIPEGVYPTPSIHPTVGEHPRLLFKQSDIPNIRANIYDSRNAKAKAHFEYMKEKTHSGKFGAVNSSGYNYNTNVIQIAEAKAFDYIINGNIENGEQAISMMDNMLNTANFAGYKFPVRAYGHMIYTCAKIYDWCYPLIEDDGEFKRNVIQRIEIYAKKLETSYPPSMGGAITGHTSESQMLVDLFSFSIAVYDEKPEVYDYVVGKIFDMYVEPRNYWYQTYSYHQGSGYVGARFYWDLCANQMWKAMTGEPLFNEENMKKVCYECIYRTRTDGEFLRMGDDYNEYNYARWRYWIPYTYIYFYGAMLFDDGYLLDMYRKSHAAGNEVFGDGAAGQGTYSSTVFLIMNNPDLKQESVSEMDKSFYCPSPNGMMYARTGWNMNVTNPGAESDVIALMKIGEINAANHNHRDTGSFQLYYKGILASDSGWDGSGYGSNHDKIYHKTSIAHNTIDIYPKDAGITDKGQRAINNGTEPSTMTYWMNNGYNTGEVLGYEAGPDKVNPEYSYIRGDITDAYDSSDADEMIRSMLFMPLDDENHPAAMVVFDKVSTTNSNYEKTWLLHMQEEPEVDETNRLVTVKRTLKRSGSEGYNGKMELKTLLPASVDYEQIGGPGQEYVVNGINYPSDGTYNIDESKHSSEAGWGRIEISPKNEGSTDLFLNVMTVSDADSTARPVECTYIDMSPYHAAVFSDRVCLFSENKGKADSINLNLESLSGTKKIFIDAVESGIYNIRNVTTNETFQTVATEDGGVLWFEAEGGAEYLVEHVGNECKIVSARSIASGSSEIEIMADISGEEASGIVIFALYKNSSVVDAKVIDYKGIGKYKVTFDSAAGGDSVMIFVWDSLYDAHPLARKYSMGL